MMNKDFQKMACHYFPPDTWLSSHPQCQCITAVWLVPCCTAWWQRNTGVINVSTVVRQSCPDWKSNRVSPTPYVLTDQCSYGSRRFSIDHVRSRFSL